MPEDLQVLTNHAAATRLRTLMAQLTHETPIPSAGENPYNDERPANEEAACTNPMT